MTKNNKKLDFIVVGDSLTALLTAAENGHRGWKGALICGADSVGGLCNTSLTFIPNNESSLALLERIQFFVPQLQWIQTDLGPITFQNGVTQPFLGFGARTVDSVDFYSYFTAPEHLKINLSFSEIVLQLLQNFSGDVLTNHEATLVQIQDGFGALQCNGTVTYTADRIYYFESPSKLGKIIPTDSPAFPKAVVQKLSKSQHWTAVNLVYSHAQELTQSEAVHILYGAKDLPCLGTFSKPTQELSTPPMSQFMSHWMSLLSSENFGDTEQLGLAIREMKKQIKRMYPSFFDSVIKESIVISPDAFSNPPAAVSNAPDIFKNGVLFLASQHYSSDMAFLGDARSYLSLRSFFVEKAQEIQSADTK